MKNKNGSSAMLAAFADQYPDVRQDHAVLTIDREMARLAKRPRMDLLTREYLVIASCVTLGSAVLQLRAHIQTALALGATKERIVEVILQVMFYAGVPAVANALNVADEVFLAHRLA